jgi:addiction module HigA family antidote
MAKKITPGDVVMEKLAEFHLSIRELAVGIKLTEASVRQIIAGKTKISLPVAFRLAKFFGGKAEDWYNIQMEYDLFALKKDAELQSILKDITKAKKLSAKEIAKKEQEAKPRRGRPAKKDEDDDTSTPSSKAKKVGKPRKSVTESAPAAEKKGKPGRKSGKLAKSDAPAAPKKRGRKSKAKEQPAEVEASVPARKPRTILLKGSKPKGHASGISGETAPLFADELTPHTEDAVNPAPATSNDDDNTWNR